MNLKLVKETFKLRPKAFFVIGALLLSNLGLYLYASMQQIPRLEGLQKEYFEKRKISKGGAVLDAASIYRQGESDLKAWRERIMPKKEFASFLANLFEAAANNSLAFKAVTYRAAQLNEENLATYSLNFNVVGKYGAVKSFIADLGRRREIMTIDNISLNSGKAAEEAVDLKVQMTVYLRMEEQ